MNSINTNGSECVPTDEARAEFEHVCVIVASGWIFEGRTNPEDPQELFDAHVVRRWTNGRGIGGLAKAEYADEYTLDAVGTVRISERAELARFGLEW